MKKEKINEIIRYLIVGVLTTVVSLGIYYGLVFTVLNPEHVIELQIANILSWIGAVIFAYVTNRIFVFRSKNTNKIKEATSFIGSRILTLLMDMGIMFLGVSVMHFNDKIIKLVSQVVITIANYVFSKLFVFASKDKQKLKKKRNEKILIFSLLLIPFLDLACCLFGNNTYVFLSILGIKVLYFLALALLVWKEEKGRLFLTGLFSFIFLFLLYSFCKDKDILMVFNYLINIAILPLVIYYFTGLEKRVISPGIIACVFVIYGALSFILANNKTFLIHGMLVNILLLPLFLKFLFKHQNYLTKGLGFLFLILLIINYAWHFPLVNQVGLLSENVSARTSYFVHSNIDEQFFGIWGLDKIKSGIDLFDIFYDFGYVGIIFYVLLIAMAFGKLRFTKWFVWILFVSLIWSFVFGDVLSNFCIGIVLASSLFIKKENKKRILLVSNMYPSKKYKHYGSFVKNVLHELELLNYEVDKCVIYKHDNVIVKLFAYLRFSIVCMIKSIFTSYDIYYVHFISHSAFPILGGKITGKTKLILNVHGNDIVPDYDYEEKNVKRSRFVLKYADLVIAPSKYFYDVLVKEYQFPKEKIQIYPSGGINFEVFESRDKKTAQEMVGLDSNYQYFGYVGRIEKNKGWDTLLEAFHELQKEKFMKNIKLVIVGTGEEQNELEAMIKKYHLEKKIIQKEFVLQKDLVNYYNAFDLFVFPTKRKSDSLGLVGLEAMACKTFVIACDLYGPREYAINKVNSLTYQDEKDLANTIKKFMKMNEKEKNKIIDKAYETAKKYDVKKLNNKLKDIFSI